jgi:uncharacterized membrane protein
MNNPTSTPVCPPNVNVARSERIASALGGVVAAGYGVHRRSAATPLFLLLGGLLVYRGLSGHCELYDRLGLNTARSRGQKGVPGNRGIRVERSVEVHRPAAQVFASWRNLENLPIFMPHLKSVTCSEDGTSHWVVEGPAGTTVEWDAEIINEHPGEMLAWQSLPGADVQHAGTVRFKGLKAGRGTRLTVVLQYQPPAGPLGAAVASILGESPDRQLEKDLARFRDWIEAEPTIVT